MAIWKIFVLRAYHSRLKTIWNLADKGREVNIPLDGYKVQEVNIAYPKNLSTPFVFNKDNIRIYFENGKSARFFEIEK